ncbi:MAG: TrkH family potassium uptake protein [Bacilli bacterium]|nr:TrkH family potassium uptake protein [Bacilli bacterium]
MNFAVIRNLLGKIMILVGILMILPLAVSIIYLEGIKNILAFLIPLVVMILFGSIFSIKKPADNKILPREGLVIVGLSWLLMSLFGCLPFIISKEIPNFVDAFFEISSGFTTTGASILGADIRIESLSHSMLFWRSFSHWIGGMGVLVFILAIIPESKEGSSMHILRAESPGPTVGKLVSRVRVTSRILYLIYIFFTALEFLLLYLGPDAKMDAFSSLLYTFGTAGTGGFGVVGSSLAYYSPYSQYVISIFMVIFSINFTIYYLILIGNFKEVFKNEELYVYLGIILISVAIIFANIYPIYHNFELAFRESLFQTTSIISTTGYVTVNYDAVWPVMAKSVLVILMFIGAMAGSTGGAIKVSRMIALVKSSIRKISNIINPRRVKVIYVNGKEMDDDAIEGVQSFFIVYLLVFVICSLLISVDGFDIISNITASLSCISNVGPGLGIVGPVGNFAGYSYFSKIILSIEMIAGRLELFPILVLFSPKTWAKRI